MKWSHVPKLEWKHRISFILPRSSGVISRNAAGTIGLTCYQIRSRCLVSVQTDKLLGKIRPVRDGRTSKEAWLDEDWVTR
jgi:hypothetical protein